MTRILTGSDEPRMDADQRRCCDMISVYLRFAWLSDSSALISRALAAVRERHCPEARGALAGPPVAPAGDRGEECEHERGRLGDGGLGCERAGGGGVRLALARKRVLVPTLLAVDLFAVAGGECVEDHHVNFIIDCMDRGVGKHAVEAACVS
jgi:hypothetical protein